MRIVLFFRKLLYILALLIIGLLEALGPFLAVPVMLFCIFGLAAIVNPVTNYFFPGFRYLRLEEQYAMLAGRGWDDFILYHAIIVITAGLAATILYLVWFWLPGSMERMGRRWIKKVRSAERRLDKPVRA